MCPGSVTQKSLQARAWDDKQLVLDCAGHELAARFVEALSCMLKPWAESGV